MVHARLAFANYKILHPAQEGNNMLSNPDVDRSLVLSTKTPTASWLNVKVFGSTVLCTLP